MVDVLLQWRTLNAFRIIADYILHPGLAALQFDFSQVRSGAALRCIANIHPAHRPFLFILDFSPL